MPDYADVWDQYDLAVGALYDALASREDVTVPTVRTADLSHRAATVISTSSRLTEASAQNLTASSAADRELATLRLMAGAAADLAIANDLVRTHPDRIRSATRTVKITYPELIADLGPILHPSHGFPRTLTTRQATFEARPEEPAEALAQLRWSVTRSFDAITDDVKDVSQMAIGGLFALQAAPVKEAAAVAVQEIVNKLGDGLDIVISQGVRLLIQAYDKILKALGRDGASDVRLQTSRWIEMLQSGTLLGKLLERLYEKERILGAIERHARGAVDALMSEAFSNVLRETRDLADRFRQQRRSVEWVLRGLAFSKEWLLSIERWGPIAVTALYLGTLGYTVYVGGDYVDWYRTERIQPLERVPGLRDVVYEALETVPARQAR